MGVNALELEPVEIAVDAVSDLKVRRSEDPDFAHTQLGPPDFVATALASGVVPAFLHGPATGETWPLPTAAALGFSSFVMHLDLSLALYLEEEEPWGAHWSSPPIDRLVEWADHWRDCHGLSSIEAQLRALFCELYGVGPEEEFRVGTPVYCVTVRDGDLETLVAETRRLRASDGAGRKLVAKSAEGEERLDPESWVGTVKAAAILGR